MGMLPGYMSVGAFNYPVKNPADRLNELRASSERKIRAHEQAHQSAAGPYGGGIVMNYDSNGIAIGGHVPISIPGLDPQNPNKNLQAYQTIYNAALAPSDPSGQDMAVAARAQALMGQAQVLMGQKNKPQP